MFEGKLNHRLALGAAALLAAAGLTTTGSSAAAAAEYDWTCQSFWQAGTVNQQAFERFAENVEKMSGGRLHIEVLPVDAVVPPSEMLDALGAGILDCMNAGTGYFTGKDPAFALLADMNAAYETPFQQDMWFWQGGGIELARDLYDDYGAYYVAPIMWGAESIPSRMPLRNVQDFKGIKMRAPEGMGAEIWNKLGVGVSTLPGTEVYTALERGKVEATDWGTLGMNDELGYGDIAPYAIYPGIHSMPSSDLAVNLDTWNGLPDDLKAVIEIAARDFNRDMLMSNAILDQQMVAKRDSETLVSWGPEERRELRKVAQEVWANWGQKSEMAGKIYQSHVDFMKQIGLL